MTDVTNLSKMTTGGASETGSVSDIEIGTDKTFDNLCSVCSRRNKNIEGSKFCTDCQEYVCSSCVNSHNDVSTLRNHQILDKVEFQHGSQSSISLIQVKNSKKYSVREKSDTYSRSYITSVCELDDGTIILSDSVYVKLKRLESSSYMVRDSCKVPAWPRQVCTISSHEVAVCCGEANLIQFVSIGLTMQMTRRINPGFNCLCLAYNDDKLFISDRRSSVYVYTLTGERLQQINKPGLFGRMFGENFYYMSISVSSDGSTIYIAHHEKGLIILDKNGQLVGEFTDSKLQGASGVCLYKDNSVLICGRDSKNVLQFTPNGKLISEILKRDKGCTALCYCKKTLKLIVGMWDEIEVFDINE